MKHELDTRTHARQFLGLLLSATLALPLPSLAASVALASSPLATSTVTTVKPNVLLLLDNSGSMDWDHMPDDASDGGSAVPWVYGYYGLRSPQCNQVYFDPTITYLTPVHPDGTSYANASFTAAWTDGYNTGAGTVNLDNNFQASQSLNGDGTGGRGYYYLYTGTQTTSLQKNYNVLPNTFSNECSSAQNAAPGNTVFTKRTFATTETTTITISGATSTSVSGITVNGVQIMSGAALATTSSTTLATEIAAMITLGGYSAVASGSIVTITGPTTAADFTPVITQAGTMVLTADVFPQTSAAQLTNFANWYSYYRTRMLMMKTATGLAFKGLTQNYRVGFMKLSASNSPTVLVDNFWDNTIAANGALSSQRTNWYNALYGTAVSGSTPLRTALSDAGRYYAGKLAVTDPIQYSCQQNFTILSTDGYWNAGNGYMMDGATMVGNQDGTAARPMYDGAQTATSVTTTYTQNVYSSTKGICGGTNKQLKTQPQIFTCTKVGTAAQTCTAPTNNGGATISGACAATQPLAGTTSTPVQSGTPVTSTGASGGSSDSLADVAMYYYQTDLRPAMTDNVFITATDNNVKQHMTTFTLGLGASGWMQYSPGYLTDTTGDFVYVKQGFTTNLAAIPPVCSWQAAGTVCNWPLPGMSGSDGLIANIDDLWHAAVNGHGAYFSATNPTTLSTGLANALAGINSRRGSAAAAATSTLNPVAGNNFAYVASYTTVKWQGNLESRGIDIYTGQISENATWCVENVVGASCTTPSSVVADTSGGTTRYDCVTPNAVICNGGTMVGTDCHVPIATNCTGTMNAMTNATSDTRTIYTANNAGTALTPFDAAYAAANPTNFSAAHINTLSQWPILTAAQQAVASGANLINFLRGQDGYEDRIANALPVDNRLYRARDAVLGDALESQPSYLSKPVFSYPYPGYSTFATANAARAGSVYMGANDGMMHSFAADTGVERWAYVPTMVIPNMWLLADKLYSTRHTNYVNGSPVTTDICTANCTVAGSAVWKTILVGGLNGGGRGYYALDITDPVTPKLLWEFSSANDADLGYSYGVPVVTRKNDGTWVVLVTSGYDNGTLGGNSGVSGTQVTNSPAGNGQGYLYVLDAGTGAIISKISTGVGTAATPSGLAKIAAWNSEPAGNLAGYVYGGDLQGNLWRFDINSTVAATIGTGDVMNFAILKDPVGATQPIMTTPVLGLINQKRVIFVGTGQYLQTADLSTTQVQTQYAIMDDNATATLVNPRNTLVMQTLTNAGASRTVSNTPVNFFTQRGWYVDFPDTGERVNIDSKLVQGTLIVPSIVPSSTTCTPGGYGWLNFFDFKSGGAVNTATSTASLKYDATIVGVNVIYIDGKPLVGAVTSDNPTPQLNKGVAFSAGVPGFAAKRLIWRELIP